MSISRGHIMSIIAAVAAFPALVNIDPVVDPHVVVDTGTAVHPLYTSGAPLVAADIPFDMAGKWEVAGMVVVIDDT